MSSRHFSDEEKKDKWVRVVAPADSTEDVVDAREASGPAPVHSPLSLYATILSPSTSLPKTFPVDGEGKARKAYIHVAQTSGYNTKTSAGAAVRITGEGGATLELREGDGAYITGEAGTDMQVANVGDLSAEVLLFDVA